MFIAPVLLGDGVRLFDHPGGAVVRLERLTLTEGPTASSLQFPSCRQAADNQGIGFPAARDQLVDAFLAQMGGEGGGAQRCEPFGWSLAASRSSTLRTLAVS